MLSTLVNILLFIFVIGFLTLIHELGHFLAAKIVGARVYEFSLGFGPKLISKKYGETLYCIRAIPLGGFVKILGDGDPSDYEEETTENLRESEYNLSNKSKVAQIFVMLAGIFMNILFAIIFYYAILGLNEWKTNPIYVDLENVNVIGVELERVVGYQVMEDGNAEKAGLPTYGVIKELDGEVVKDRDALVEMIGKKEEVTLLICDDMGDECRIGVYVSHGHILEYSSNKVIAGPIYLVNNLKIISKVLGSMIGVARETGDYSDLSHTVSGPIGIFLLIDNLKTRGVIVFLSLIADLSISLAIMNLLPIPALDGGRVLIITLEGILRKEFDEKLKAIIINISMVLLIVLVVLVMIKDVVNIESMRSMFE
jgi:regulator of sigma E protease